MIRDETRAAMKQMIAAYDAQGLTAQADLLRAELTRDDTARATAAPETAAATDEPETAVAPAARKARKPRV